MSGPEDRLPPDDGELDDFLAGHGPHHARYRAAATEQAPAHLDDAVLAQARMALQTKPHRRATRRWRVPLSIAATLVLGIALVGRVQREAPPPGTISETNAEVAAKRVAAQSAAVEAPVAADMVVEPPEIVVAPQAAPRVLRPQSAKPAAVAPPPPPPPPPVAAAAVPQAPPKAEVDAMAAYAEQAQRASAERLAQEDSAQRKQSEARQEAMFAARAAPAPALDIRPSSSNSDAGRYRSEQGAELELGDDGRFRLEAISTARVVSGQRQRDDAGDWLQAEGEAACRWSLRHERDGLRLQATSSACADDWNGLYRLAGSAR